MKITLTHVRALVCLGVIASMVPIEASADVRTEARRHFRRGMELVVEGRLDEGVAELEEAYNILPHPNVLYNIGRAYAENGRYDDALEYFERYLATDPPDREEVNGFVSAIQQRISARDDAARATAAATTTTTTTTTTGTETTTTGPTVRVSEAEIVALEESATQIETLAEVTDSDALRQRAVRLRQLATDMRAANTAARAGMTTTTTTTGQTETSTGTSTGTSEGEGDGAGLALGEGSSDLYQEQVVSATSFAQNPLDAPNSTTNITRQDIRLTGITQIGELLRRVAGVQVMTTAPGETNIGIRGFNQRLAPRVLMLINGRSTYVDPFGNTFWANMPISVEDIERIEVIRGPASALYGANGFSGVINIITRAPGDTTSTEASVGAGNDAQLRAYVGTSGRTGNFGYRISAGYQQANRFTFRTDPNRVDVISPENNELGVQDAKFRIDTNYRIGRNAEIFAEGGVDYIGAFSFLATGAYEDFNATGPFSYGMVGLRHNEWGQIRGFWNRFTLSGQSVGGRPVDTRMIWNTYDVEARLDRGFETGPIAHNLTLGAGYRRKTVEWDLFLENYHEDHFQVFFQDALRFGQAVQIVGGFRMDQHPLLDKPVWSPRAALVLRPSDTMAIRVSYSTAFRTFSFIESYTATVQPTPISAVGARGLGTALEAEFTGARGLSPEKIRAVELGYAYVLEDYFSLDAAVYYNRVFNIINLSSSATPFTLSDYAGVNPNIAEYADFDRRTNQFNFGFSGFANDSGRYDVVGAEVGMRAYPLDGLDIWANYSLNKSWQVINGVRTEDRRTSTHQVNAGVQYRADISNAFGLDFGVDVHYASEQSWGEQVVGENSIVYEQFPLDAYHMINGRVGIRLLDDDLSLGVSGYNITNRQIRQHPFGQVLDARVMASLSYRFD